MNMISACFIKFTTKDVFLETEGSPTIHVNRCFHYSTSPHGSDGRPQYSVCLFMKLYCVCNSFLSKSGLISSAPYDNKLNNKQNTYM